MRDWQVKGILQSLWDFTAENAMAGDVGRFTNSQIALGIDFDGDADSLIDALVATRWVDEHKKHRLVIHDWHEHCEEWIKKRCQRAGIKLCPPRGSQRTSRKGFVEADLEIRPCPPRGRQRQTTADNGSLPGPGPGPGIAVSQPRAPPKQPKTIAKNGKTRPPNPLWDALAAVFYPSGIAPGQQKHVGALVRDFKAKGATAEELRIRVNRYKQAWPNHACTPNAMLEHWDEFGPQARPSWMPEPKKGVDEQ